MADLMKYLPPYYQIIAETNAIMNAENPEFGTLNMALVQVKNNQFIIDADELVLRKWEALLNIRPDYMKQSIDYRKAVVLMRLSTRMPLTHRWLKEKLTSLVGERHFLIQIDYPNYELLIRLSNDRLKLLDELRKYLREIIPANMTLSIIELFRTWGEIKKKTWGELKKGTWYEARVYEWGDEDAENPNL